MAKKTERICPEGHHYFKSSQCPVCPFCENENKAGEGFLSNLSAPARRALVNNGVTSLKQLANYSEKEILQWHGLGPASLLKLRIALKTLGLNFKMQ